MKALGGFDTTPWPGLTERNLELALQQKHDLQRLGLCGRSWLLGGRNIRNIVDNERS